MLSSPGCFLTNLGTWQFGRV